MARPLAAVVGVALLLTGGGQTTATGAPSSTEIDELIARLPGRHWEAAVDRLVEIGPPAVGPLTAATRGSGRVGGRACEALARIGTGPALEVLRDAARELRVVDSVPLYPETLESRPQMASPSTRADGTDVVLAVTAEGRWAVVPAGALDDERRERQRRVDAHDFPTLARTGLHCPQELAQTVTITGRSLAEITDLGRPGGLSEDGFMAADEDVLSVLQGDNRLVSALGLTHSQMARPLLHVWNMIEADVEVGRWNRAEHRWDRIRQIVYNDRHLEIEAHDTKGGQESIFDDELRGAFSIKVQRAPTPREERFLRQRYGSLPPRTWNAFVRKLTAMETGEMEPHYIQRYGFYEGHTNWRTDPIAIAFVFGLRSLEEIEAAFPGRLDEVLRAHFTR